ncbi:hypothetical protein KUTeg_022094 [Tegillarca granosa]|uniref:Alpha-MPP n=1 Tax=Tegillarca granosa TaxID=220873 RepID=A0ABQ9E617_TEGGR|nr:hypothetical protein KUTeg_022094 [Tegillarca granosa]
MATSRMFVKVFRHNYKHLSRHTKRRFCSSNNTNDITTIPLSQPIPGFTPKYAVNTGNSKIETEVTTLENGLRVASENKYGQSCTVGILIESGSRFEVAYPSGISHFLEKLAFGSTTEFENHDQILLELSQIGGICDSQSSRDIFMYAMSGNTNNLPSLINILSEAAYRGNTLGLPKICQEANISIIDKKVLYTYMKNFHTPDRMVVAGVGMDHKTLVDLVRKYFIELKRPIWEEDSNLIDKSKHVDKSIAQYTGGDLRVEKDLSDVSLGPTPMPELAHVMFGLESCSHQDDDFLAFCVLNMMMGGGGSFSSGGPGKGMYSRLYLNVLNRYHWINNATAYNVAYDDTGLFFIHASSHPDNEELNRAKTQLQSMLLMNLEARPVIFEDIGRQVIANGFRHQPQYYYDAIGRVTASDIQRVADRMLNTKLTIAALGNLFKLPDRDTIQSMIYKHSNSFRQRFRIFK